MRELRSHALAEDVCQETLMRVMERLQGGKLESPEALPGFVAGTARNVIREVRRKEGRVSSIGEMEFAADEKEPSVDDSVRRALDLALKRLKPRERDLLRLYYYEELSKDEISRKLGIDAERVRLVKSRALKSFREFYLRLTGIQRAK